ncbi:MAG: hypothetical protein WA010_09060, partial [Sulfuricurvum sp.]
GIDAFLVRDLNRDGMINDGSELFGSATVLSNGTKAKEGYAALSDLDDNHDTMLTTSDQAFAELSLWIDTNHNGISENNEFQSLTDAGIKSILLDTTKDATTDNGNTIGLISSYTKVSGETYTAADVWFAAETFDYQGIVQAIAETQIAGSWYTMNDLLDHHLNTDTIILGGDMACSYAKEGELSRMSIAGAQSTLNDPNFAVAAQALNTNNNLYHY